MTTKLIDRGGVAGCDVPKARLLQRDAYRKLGARLEPLPGTVACDVVICCTESTHDADRAIQSLLNQNHVHLFIHLVDDGGGAAEIVRRYELEPNVVTYHHPLPKGLLATLQELVPRLRSSYVALQDPTTVSLPDRIRTAVTMLEAHGAEFLAAPVRSGPDLLMPEPPREPYQRYLPWQSLVCRRASLVDMGGIADRPGDQDAELIYRAFRESRRILISEEPAVECLASLARGTLGPTPSYDPPNNSLRRHAIGFPRQSVRCDVVLPFHGHLDFVAESMPSVLEQDSAETIVHLIDDATPGGAQELLKYWGTHPRVRTYRNTRNLGQFVTFNNVFPYLETNLIAIQDADDISFAHRINLAGNHLRLADADFFGGRFETFEHSGDPPPEPGIVERRPYWASEYPRRFERIHFLQNTTAVMSKGAFESLRGFSDYGTVDRNKCGLDTEFFVRAHHAGCRFVMTHDTVVRYRWHRKSVTRNDQTGWGSEPRDWVAAENERRFKLYHRGPFDPRALGSLRASWGTTERIR
jgi:glycosyltransferase involved in cell wall biosynthesis